MWKFIRDLTLSQMKARYRRTFAGFLWVVLNPIIMYSAQAMVFRHVLRINLPNYGLFLLGGLLPWIFIISSLDMGISVLQGSKDLLFAFKMHPFILIGCSLLDNWINFLAAFFIILFPTLFFSPIHFLGLLLIPLAVVQLLLGVGAGLWFLSVLNVFYRDIRYIVHFMTSILFFLTPIFYPESYVPERVRWLIKLNPIYILIKPLRFCVYDFSLADFAGVFIQGTTMSLALLMLSIHFWKRKKNEFYFYL